MSVWLRQMSRVPQLEQRTKHARNTYTSLMYLAYPLFIPSPPLFSLLLAVISFFSWVLAIADFVSSIVHSLKTLALAPLHRKCDLL